ncbi:MAG: thiamine phosphate synthase [Bacteroidales bacterium]|jgi:thiamine-phosphate pyrophosphorylase|nr:thiamine phosphate synthase [Bacteroidales bacterium]
MEKFSATQFITHTIPGLPHHIQARRAIEGGINWVQVRVKNQPDEQFQKVANAVIKECRDGGATIIINDRADFVNKLNADGVHLGKGDMSVSEARRIVGPDKIIGGTANTFEDIESLVSEGVDYIGLGPFRFTTTKQKLSPVLGIDGYSKVVSLCRDKGIDIPIVAIGGITNDDIPDILSTGVNGVAFSSLITSRSDIEVAASEIVSIVKSIKTK